MQLLFIRSGCGCLIDTDDMLLTCNIVSLTDRWRQWQYIMYVLQTKLRASVLWRCSQCQHAHTHTDTRHHKHTNGRHNTVITVFKSADASGWEQLLHCAGTARRARSQWSEDLCNTLSWFVHTSWAGIFTSRFFMMQLAMCQLSYRLRLLSIPYWCTKPQTMVYLYLVGHAAHHRRVIDVPWSHEVGP